MINTKGITTATAKTATKIANIHMYSLYVNVVGIIVWIVLYFHFLKLHQLPKDLQYIHYASFVIIGLFVTNIMNSDTRGESSFDVEMKLKDDVETLSSKLIILIATVLFSTSLLMKYKLTKEVKQTFMTILTTAMIILLLIASSINTPKTAVKVRQLRKIESVFMNIAVGLICVAFLYIVHYL